MMKNIVLISIVVALLFCSCNRNKTDGSQHPAITAQMAFEGVNNYCHSQYDWSAAADNPSMMSVTMGDETDAEYEVIFRSYTGALVHFHVDKATGKTRMVESVPTLGVDSTLGTIDILDYIGKAKPTIHIYRYGTFPEAKAKQLKAVLEKVYSSVSLADEAIELPADCYYKPRDRYRGTGLLDDLRKLRHGGYALGLTNKIIYYENEISPTFGIFGISYMGDSVSVISSLRPRTLKPLTDDDLQELMLHELGHAFGLPHCKDEQCMMVDAEHGYKFAQTQSFCPSCRDYLNNKGWTLR